MQSVCSEARRECGVGAVPRLRARRTASTFHRRKVDRKAAGGPLYQRRNAPRNPPFALSEDGFCCIPSPRPPQGLAPLCKGSWQGRQALTEGLWVAYRNGLPLPGHLLLHHAYNPSASHLLSTSPYTGEARGGGRWLASHHFAGHQGGLDRTYILRPFLSYSILATALHKISAERCAAFCSNWS